MKLNYTNRFIAPINKREIFSRRLILLRKFILSCFFILIGINNITAQTTPPVAYFDYSPNSPVEGSAIQFNDLSTDGPTDWYWDFGDGNTSTDQSPSYTYTSAGSYYVELTASNIDGSSNYDVTINVDPASSGTAPVAYFDYNPLSPVTGTAIQFNDLSTDGPKDWYWDFGDGNTSTDQNPSYTYTAAGNYYVQLTVSNTYGSDTYLAVVTVEEVTTSPISNFDIDTYYGTAPLTINVSDLSTNVPDTWAWDFGDPANPNNTSNSNGPLSFTYANPGTYVVSLTVSNSFGTDTYTTFVFVDPANALTAQFSADNYYGDAPLTVQFTDESTNNPTSWTWDFGDPADPNNISYSNGPVAFTYTAPGDYVVSLNVQDGTNSDTYTTTIFVNAPGAISNAAFSSDVTSGNAPLTVYFQDESTDNPSSWNWDFGNNEYSSDQNTSTTYSEPGTYIVTLQVDNASTITHTIQVNNSSLTPVANYSTDVLSGVAPLTVNFTDLTTNNPQAWNWDFGDYSNSTEQNPTYTFVLPGTYVVNLTVDNTDGSSTYSTTITVNSSNSSFMADKYIGPPPLTIQFTDQTANATQWEWNFGNPSDVSNNTTNSQNPSYTYTAPGIYTVTLKSGDNNILDSTTSVIEVTDPNGGYITAYNLISGSNDSTVIYYEAFDGSGFINSGNMIKICADGSESTVLYCIINDAANLASRIKSDPNGLNENLVGKIVSTTTTDDLNLRIQYQSPNQIDIDHLNDYIELYNTTTQQIMCTIPLRYFNAPIVMLHGLWARGSFFNDMADELKAGPAIMDELVNIKDYSATNAAHFSENIPVVTSGVNEALKAATAAGFSAGKVTLIGHSMGGILSRLYAQTEGSALIYKLITINTPHSGSQIADLVSSPKWYGAILRNIINLTGRSPYAGAVEDLKTSGTAIFDLNSGTNCANIPCHAISSFVTSPEQEIGNVLHITNKFGSSLIGISQMLFGNNQSSLSTFFQNLFSSEPYDMIVSLPSQEAGLSGNHVSQFSDISHGYTLGDTPVTNKIISLLLADPNGPEFNQSGYNAPVITPYFSRAETAFVNQGGGAVNIISPPQSIVVHPGDIVPITVTSTGSFKHLLLGVGNTGATDNYGFYKDSATNFLTVYYKVPPIFSGKLRIGAVAYDSTGYASDSLNLFVNPTNLQLDSISVSPKKLFIQKGGNSSLFVTGHFKGIGAIDISNMDNVTYTSSNLAITSQLNNSNFKGNHKGSTAISIFFNGKSKQIPVSVIDSLTYNSAVTSVKENTLPKNKSKEMALKVYPNPNNGMAYVDYTLNTTEKVILDVLDLNGKTIKSIISAKQIKGSYTQNIDCSSLVNGLYVIRIQCGNQFGYSKLIVVK